MASPPSRRAWVEVLLALVLLADLPGSLQKCIFDEVQAQVSVVRAGPISPPSETTLAAPAGPGWRASPLQRLPNEWGEVAPPTPESPQPIRIKTWVTVESASLTESETQRLKAAVGKATGTVSSLLSVVRGPGPLLLSRDINKYCKFVWRNPSTINCNRCGGANNNYRTETCLDVTIPDDHLAGCHVFPEADSTRRFVLRPQGAGLPDVDFVLYLHVQATDKCRSEPNVLAYAVHCQTDTRGRPVAGVVVFCRDRLSGATYSHLASVQTVIHELFHALGFSKELFHTWRDCSSSTQGGAGCFPRGGVTHADGSGLMRIYSPSVISALQRHLGSNDPELGGPLENLDVPPGGVSSHWESRVMRGSIMVAVLEDATTVRIDPITLAAFQDTGWYTVNLSRAQSLVWGDGAGDPFVPPSACRDNSSSYFCTGSGLGCHYLHLHKGECQTDPYLEGCRVYKTLKNARECWRKENHKDSAEEHRSGEIFGSDSRCFFSSLTRQSQFRPLTSATRMGRCYRHRCTGPNRYQVQVSGSDWVDCPAGGTIQVLGYQGSVFCPDRRLCLYPDVAPPSNDDITLPASVTSGPDGNPVRDGTWSDPGSAADLTVAMTLTFTAAVILLAAVRLSYRKCCPRRVQIHITPEDPVDPGGPRWPQRTLVAPENPGGPREPR
ncbi:ciliated left-right organizer metallopeptidase [Aulostomus maculatus]